MENEIRKQVKKETQKLSEFKPKVVSLDFSKGMDIDEDILQEDVRNEFELKLQDRFKLRREEIDNCSFDIIYDLSDNQGNGFGISKGYLDLDVAKKITKGENHRFKGIDITGNFKIENANRGIGLWVEAGDEIKEMLSEKQEEKLSEMEELIEERLKDFCREMFKIGQDILEEREKEDILKAGLDDFLAENELKTHKFLDEFNHKVVELNYLHKPKEEQDLNGFVKICESGDTGFELWLEDFEITKTKEAVIKFEEEKQI